MALIRNIMTGLALLLAVSCMQVQRNGGILPTSPQSFEQKCEELLAEGAEHQKNQEYDLALERVLEALEVAADNHLDEQRADALCAAANIDLATYNDPEAWERACKAEQIARSHHLDHQISKALVIKGKVCTYAGSDEASSRDDEAMGYLQDAIDIAREGGFADVEAEAYLMMSASNVNKNRWRDDLSAEYREQARLCLEKADAIIAADSLETLRVAAMSHWLRYYRQGGQTEEAISHCENILEECAENDDLMRMQMYDHLTVLYAQNGDAQESINAHQQYASRTLQYLKHRSADELDELNSKYIRTIAEHRLARQKFHVIELILLLMLATGAICYLIARQRRLRLYSEQIARENLAKEQFIKRLMKEDVSKEKIAEMIAKSYSCKDPGSLVTQRELEIIYHSAQGLSTTEIATLLNLSTRTVSNHKQSIYNKLKVTSNSKMVEKAAELGLI